MTTAAGGPRSNRSRIAARSPVRPTSGQSFTACQSDPRRRRPVTTTGDDTGARGALPATPSAPSAPSVKDEEDLAGLDLLADGDVNLGDGAAGGAAIWCSIFIASTITRAVAGLDAVARDHEHSQHGARHGGDERASGGGGGGVGMTGRHAHGAMTVGARRRGAGRRRGRPDPAADTVDVDDDLVGGDRDRHDGDRVAVDGQVAVPTEAVADGRRRRRRRGSRSTGRRRGCCASRTGRWRAPTHRPGGRPARRGRRRPVQAAVAGDRLGEGSSSRKPVAGRRPGTAGGRGCGRAGRGRHRPVQAGARAAPCRVRMAARRGGRGR